jgi:hypothetical protein
MLICMKCGNIKEFEVAVSYHEYGRCTVNPETEEIDGDSFEADDSDMNDEESDFICSECDDNCNVDSLEKKKLLQTRWEHTDKKGEWHTAKLKENDRNKKLASKYMIAVL